MEQDITIFEEDDTLGLEHLSAAICTELAAGLADQEGIKEKYELTDAQWDRLKRSKFFRSMLKEAGEKLKGDMNAGARITLKSEVMLEDTLPVLHRIAHSGEYPTSERLNAIKQMATLAGRTQQQAQGTAGGGGFNVNISINTGPEEKPVAIEGELSPSPGG